MTKANVGGFLKSFKEIGIKDSKRLIRSFHQSDEKGIWILN
jgi:hypothetical protein